MIDSDDVLLLKPAFDGAGLTHPPAPRPSATASRPAATIVVATTRPDGATAADQVRDFATECDAIAEAHGARPLAWYVTEPAENTFPALPVRTDVSVLVNISAFDDAEQHRECLRRRPGGGGRSLRSTVSSHLRLEPTARLRCV